MISAVPISTPKSGPRSAIDCLSRNIGSLIRGYTFYWEMDLCVLSAGSISDKPRAQRDLGEHYWASTLVLNSIGLWSSYEYGVSELNRFTSA